MYRVSTQSNNQPNHKAPNILKTLFVSLSIMIPLVAGYSYGAKAIFGI